MPVKSIVTIDKLRTSITPKKQVHSSIKGVYPFRVRFENLAYPGFSTNTSPGIGLAIIGSTFLIL
jgi:hypothetical protein